jgi:type I restriction enzyme S subunit
MRVKLEDVVDRITGNEDRFDTNLIYYIGGEHYESSSIAIYDRGLLNSEKGQTLGFKFHFPFQAGDVLFMARNPHLRKAGMVDFDGICSDASYILRSKDESKLLQKYLPLIIQNDKLWDFFEANKSGSVNYLMNWKELKNYEFDLPDISEQERLAEIAWKMEKTRKSYYDLLAETDNLVKSQFIERFDYIPEEQYVPLNDVCNLITDGTHNPPKFVDSGIPFLLVSNITGNVITYDTTKYITEETYGALMKRTPIEVGDVLLSTVGSYGHPAIVTEEKKFSFQRHIAHLKPNRELINSQYLHTVILSDDVQRQIEQLVLGVAQKTLNLAAIKSIKIPLPQLEEQIAFNEFVQQTDKSKFELKEAIKKLEKAQAKFVSENC